MPQSIRVNLVYRGALIIGCSNPSLGSAKHNLWNCGGTLGETSLDFGGSCQGGDMQVSLQKKKSTEKI